jgi:hypothetical protein
MSIEGRIAVDVNFTDSATNPASVKKIQLVASDAYSTGKVILLSGTVNTAASSIDVNPSAYRGADGSLVSFATGVTRVAFAVSGTNQRTIEDAGETMALRSLSSRVAVGECSVSTQAFTIAAGSGTAAYTAVFYGT